MLYVWVGFVFLIGAAVGSFLNVCVARLPFEKSILWPGSRCGRCFQPIRSRDNIPLLGYWLLGGRCRSLRPTVLRQLFLRRAVHRLRLRRPLLSGNRPQRARPAVPARARQSDIEWGIAAVAGVGRVRLPRDPARLPHRRLAVRLAVPGSAAERHGLRHGRRPDRGDAVPPGRSRRRRRRSVPPPRPVAAAADDPGPACTRGRSGRRTAGVAAAGQLAARPGHRTGRGAGRHGDAARRALPVRPGPRQGGAGHRRRRRDDDGRQLPRLAADAGRVLRRRLRRPVLRRRPAGAQGRSGPGVRPRPGRRRDDHAADAGRRSAATRASYIFSRRRGSSARWRCVGGRLPAAGEFRPATHPRAPRGRRGRRSEVRQAEASTEKKAEGPLA